MRGTDTITLYNAIKGAHGDITAWHRVVIANVHLEPVKGAATAFTNRSEQRNSLVMIWAEAIANQGLQCVTKDVLSALEDYTGYFALCNGDYIVPGICDGMPSAGQSIKAFLQTYDVLQITAVERCLYGSPYLQHWEVTVAWAQA
ncbi:MAG: hypothetical protein LUH03_09945 [Oscillospiraceae bacterium]|nr:hypothetical protein [Oscillospiraceae bacterium]